MRKSITLGPMRLHINTACANEIVGNMYYLRNSREMAENEGKYKYVLFWNNRIIFGGALGSK